LFKDAFAKLEPKLTEKSGIRTTKEVAVREHRREKTTTIA